MTFRVTILGSGSALPTANIHHSAHALNVHEQFYLIDCGEGTQSRLMQYGMHPMKIRAIFLSHLHGDHVYGVFPLISSLGLMGRKTPLPIFAPHPFQQMLECNARYMEHDLPFEVQFHEVDTRQNRMIFENRVMEVWTIPLRHRVPACGYLFREKTPALNVRKETIDKYGLSIAQIVAAKRGEDLLMPDDTLIANSELTYTPFFPRSYAYCSDTQASGKVASLVAGVDLLYHEATFAQQDAALAKQTGHSTTAQAAGIAAKAGVGKLLIGHFSGRYKDTSLLVDEARAVFSETFAADEGKSFEIPALRPSR